MKLTQCDLILLTSLSSKCWCSKISVEGDFHLGKIMPFFRNAEVVSLSTISLCVMIAMLMADPPRPSSDLGHLFYTTLLLLFVSYSCQRDFLGGEENVAQCMMIHYGLHILLVCMSMMKQETFLVQVCRGCTLLSVIT